VCVYYTLILLQIRNFWNLEFPFSCLYILSRSFVRKWLHASEQTPPCHEKTPRRAHVIKGIIRTPDKSGFDQRQTTEIEENVLVEYTDLVFSKSYNSATTQYLEKDQNFKNFILKFRKLWQLKLQKYKKYFTFLFLNIYAAKIVLPKYLTS